MGEVVQLVTPYAAAKRHAEALVEQTAADAFERDSRQYKIFMDIANNMFAEAYTIGDVDRQLKILIGTVLFTM